MKAFRILGVDPGSRFLGYGMIECQGRTLTALTHGTLSVGKTSLLEAAPLDQRLLEIHRGLDRLIREFSPHALSIEKAFFAKNAASALKLGHARGAAILTAAIHGLEFHEYSPSEIKASVTGHGSADKEQVAQMVRLMLGNLEFKTFDASDALAVALCHAQRVRSPLQRLTQSTLARSSKNRGKSLAQTLGITAKRELK